MLVCAKITDVKTSMKQNAGNNVLVFIESPPFCLNKSSAFKLFERPVHVLTMLLPRLQCQVPALMDM